MSAILALSLCPSSYSGADDQNRTGDLVLTKDALCQLSYIGLIFVVSQQCCRRPPLAAADNSRWTYSVACRAQPTSFVAAKGWSGRRGSNPRPTAWKAVTLPLSYSRVGSLTDAPHSGGCPPSSSTFPSRR